MWHEFFVMCGAVLCGEVLINSFYWGYSKYKFWRNPYAWKQCYVPSPTPSDLAYVKPQPYPKPSGRRAPKANDDDAAVRIERDQR